MKHSRRGQRRWGRILYLGLKSALLAHKAQRRRGLGQREKGRTGVGEDGDNETKKTDK